MHEPYTKSLSLGRQGELPIGQEKAPWGGCRACRGGEGIRCTFAIHKPFDCMLLYSSAYHQYNLFHMPTNCCPLSVALVGASSPQGEPLLTLTSIHLVSTRRVSLLPKVNSSCLHTENLSYTDPNAISKSNSDLPHKERSLQIIAKI